MNNMKQQNIHPVAEVKNSDYLRGYRDGMKDRRAVAHPAAGDGLLGALLAIALIAGVGYFGYNYMTTGRLLPPGVELQLPLQQPTTPES